MKADMDMADEDLALVLRALGHPVRLSIMRILAEQSHGNCCCTDVTQCLSLAQSTVSQHIKVLLDAGLVLRHPRGTRNCYSLSTPRIEALGAACAGLFSGFAVPAQRPVREPA